MQCITVLVLCIELLQFGFELAAVDCLGVTQVSVAGVMAGCVGVGVAWGNQLMHACIPQSEPNLH